MSGSPEEKRKTISTYVQSERKRAGIYACDRIVKIEGSGYARGSNGDIESLIDVQLLTTEEGFGSWTELDNPEVLNLVFDVVQKRIAWQQAR
jgi:hypothetical protein